MIVPVFILLLAAAHSLPTPDLTSEQTQHKFANFPIREDEEQHHPEVARPARQANSALPEPLTNYQFDYSEETLGLTSGPRASRQVNSNTPIQYQDSDSFQENDNIFQEEAVVFTPEERADTDNFGYYSEEPLEETVRQERDGGFHGPAGHSPRQGRRQGARARPAPQAQQEQFEEPRGGRQTQEVGLALGVLNSPPTADGQYNFNFSNDDGSFREESRNSQGFVAGSYGFISPNGDQSEISYTADENGYHVEGLPCPPHTLRLLEHLNKVNGGGPLTC